MKHKITQVAIIIVIIAGLGTAGYFGYKEIRKAIGSNNGAKLQDSPELSSDQTAAEEQVYTHPDYGFTLRYPGNLNLGKFPEGEGEIVLLQGANAQQGFQIYITAYEEEEPFSFEVIRKSAPDLKIENERTIELIPADEETGEEAITALSFESGGEAGRTREIWFEAYSNLYQATSFKEYGEEMERILGSLSFN